MTSVKLFAGPSAHGVAAQRLLDRHTELLAPARRGDIDRLVDGTGEPGVVVLCDGAFQSAPAVSHAEICNALDVGWQVWGVSSIGAIRAFEMRGEGMRGFGWVYAQFACHDDFTDDELCLLHLPEAPFLPVTEALVNVRYALDRQGVALGIGARSARRLVAALQCLWFGHRSSDRIFELAVSAAGIEPAAASALVHWVLHHRVKTLDLVRLMQRRPWRRG